MSGAGEMPGDTPAVNLTLRMLMSGKEVGLVVMGSTLHTVSPVVTGAR